MKVRRANQKDVELLSSFVKEINAANTAYGHIMGKEYFKSMIRSGFVFIAEDQKVAKGILVAEVDARIQFSNIVHVVSHPEVDENIAKEFMLKKYVDECKKMNISDIALQTPETETSSLEFFQGMGFNAQNKFILMTKTL